MTKFEGCYLTGAGRSIVYGNGLTNLVFTKAVTGSGTYISKEEISDMTELKELKQEFGLDSFLEGNNCTVCIKFKIDNAQLEEGYQLSEIGIYARADGGEEILYCVAYAMDGYTETVPSYDGTIIYYMAVEIKTVVSSEANVSIVYSEEHEWSKNYIDGALADIFNGEEIEDAFYFVFTGLPSIETGGSMSSEDILSAISTTWDGQTSSDSLAMSAAEITEAVNTTWDGQTSADARALTSAEISKVTN